MAAAYRGPMNRVLDEIAYLRDEFRDNEAAQVLKEDLAQVTRTLIYDEQVCYPTPDSCRICCHH